MSKQQKAQSKYANLEPIFNPKSVAIIGASEKPGKVGHAIMQNYADVGFEGNIYPINVESTGTIMGHTAYRSVADVRKPIDMAVISIPSQSVPKVMEECGRAGVKGAVVVSSGFAEIGQIRLQDRIVSISKKYGMTMVGPNCLGVMDIRARNDTMFLPTFKIDRPKIGGVSFVSQSGSVGSTTLDMISSSGFGLSRFISYGNAAAVDEVDILHYLAHDVHTQVIVLYLEGVKRGREFIEVAKEVTRLKPVVAIKAGSTPMGAGAAHSHTASLAGHYAAYDAVFRQYGFVTAEDTEDLLYFAKTFDTQPLTTGNRVAVITNGGGHGVLAADAIYKSGMSLPPLSPRTAASLRKVMPPTVNVRMPLDIGGDADSRRFSDALEIVSRDPSVDALMVITLFQTPGADDKVAESVIDYAVRREKPLVVVSTGGTYTKSHTTVMESSGVPIYDSTAKAAKSLAALIGYSRYRERCAQKEK